MDSVLACNLGVKDKLATYQPHLTRLPCDIGGFWDNGEGGGRLWGEASQAKLEEEGKPHAHHLFFF